VQRWEYKTEATPGDQDQDEVLNELGRQGWELVGITSIVIPLRLEPRGGLQVHTPGGSSVFFVFKREIATPLMP
jgi:hypothetical protein